MLSKTNFSNVRDFQLLLQLLHSTFKEFKTHEQIENECILAKLRSRLQGMSITNSLVYKAHSDNKLSEMLSLFEKGLRNAKNEYERVNYGNQLKEELEAFTQGFIPHMKEEEEVFQPLLMEYFTYDELKDIKSRVIAQHCSLGAQDSGSRPVGSKGNSATQQLGKLELDGKGEEKEARSSAVLDLPTDVMLHVFGFLGVRDLCRCAQVCLTWAQLAMDGSLWKHLYPVRWSQGGLNFFFFFFGGGEGLILIGQVVPKLWPFIYQTNDRTRCYVGVADGGRDPQPRSPFRVTRYGLLDSNDFVYSNNFSISYPHV
uniref:F-box domain-containing protein n=1 Tax=Eptatretus burgeri TaxID=7764 RepID=A0A8C4NEC0_EPTBU